jgi:hypothetical protein
MPKEIVLGPASRSGQGAVQVSWNPPQETAQVEIITSHRETEGEIEGVSVQLDRAGINQLIRNLRRARNVSFEKDE